MTNNEYVKSALRTLSNQFHDEIIGCDELIASMKSVIGKSQNLDLIKKALFYGKEPPAVCYFPKAELSSVKYKKAIPALHHDQGENILHGVIGIATEAGELLEPIVESMQTGKSLDRVNIKEELGDLLWYIAIICYATGLSFEEIMETNIDKLKLRFPEKFTEEQAIDRDTDKERKLLEAGSWE